MQSITARCDTIIALIDDCLAEQRTTLRLVAEDSSVAGPRNPPRRLRVVRSER
jgi:hypothetical protein